MVCAVKMKSNNKILFLVHLNSAVFLLFIFYRKITNEKGLPEKKFVPCNSLLTDLLEVQHIRTIYHIFIVILFLLFLNTLVHDFVADGT